MSDLQNSGLPSELAQLSPSVRTAPGKAECAESACANGIRAGWSEGTESRAGSRIIRIVRCAESCLFQDSCFPGVDHQMENGVGSFLLKGASEGPGLCGRYFQNTNLGALWLSCSRRSCKVQVRSVSVEYSEQRVSHSS